MLISMKKLLDIAKERKFAVPAPTVWSNDTIEAAYQVGRELDTPLILMVWDDGPEWITKIGNLVKYYDTLYPDVIAALLLDHGQSFDSAMAAIKCGYTTVMADYSSKPLEENIASVKRIVDAAHAVNVAVEAELGHVGDAFEYEETRDAGLTDPDEAQEYVRRTGCDMLAVAVGTSHGTYKGEPKLEFGLLEKLNSLLDIPLVLHGGSGTGEENLAKAVEIGIQKVNLCTDLFIGYEKAVREADQKLKPYEDYLALLFAGPEGYKEVLRGYVHLFKAEGKAKLYQEYKAARREERYYEGSGETFQLTL